MTKNKVGRKEQRRIEAAQKKRKRTLSIGSKLRFFQKFGVLGNKDIPKWDEPAEMTRQR
jgi:hypothetical protein